MKSLRIVFLFIAVVSVFSSIGYVGAAAAGLSSYSYSSLSSGVRPAVIPPTCKGTPNLIPIHDSPPRFVRSVPNGKLYITGAGNDTFQIVHLWGTPYEKGFAQGRLMQSEMKMVAAEMKNFLEKKIHEYFDQLDPKTVELIVKYGVNTLLRWTYEWTLPFMRQEYIDEMNGIADGSGVPIDEIRMYNMYPELTKASCSIVGANGPATPAGLLHQLRALDIGPDIPIKDQSQVTVYHNNNNNTVSDGSENSSPQSTFLTVGWTGMVGALTGFNEKGVGIAEKLWLGASVGEDDVRGEPWMFVLRNVIANTERMPEALKVIEKANRTCAIHVGIGTASDNQFRGLEIAARRYTVYNWSSPSLDYEGHPMIPGVLYWNKHKQPSSNPCFAELLQQYKNGEMTAEALALQISPIAETGNFHNVAFDYGGRKMLVANSRKTFVTEGSINAFDRQYTRVDMQALFEEKY